MSADYAGISYEFRREFWTGLSYHQEQIFQVAPNLSSVSKSHGYLEGYFERTNSIRRWGRESIRACE
jgi:hypothetical protein